MTRDPHPSAVRESLVERFAWLIFNGILLAVWMLFFGWMRVFSWWKR